MGQFRGRSTSGATSCDTCTAPQVRLSTTGAGAVPGNGQERANGQCGDAQDSRTTAAPLEGQDPTSPPAPLDGLDPKTTVTPSADSLDASLGTSPTPAPTPSPGKPSVSPLLESLSVPLRTEGSISTPFEIETSRTWRPQVVTALWVA